MTPMPLSTLPAEIERRLDGIRASLRWANRYASDKLTFDDIDAIVESHRERETQAALDRRTLAPIRGRTARPALPTGSWTQQLRSTLPCKQTNL